nr:hypothetical protein [Pectobacterium carotovorum]
MQLPHRNGDERRASQTGGICAAVRPHGGTHCPANQSAEHDQDLRAAAAPER